MQGVSIYVKIESWNEQVHGSFQLIFYLIKEQNNMLRSIVVESYKGTEALELEALLGSKGRIFLTSDINPETAVAATKALMYLSENDIPIKIYLDSCGGGVRAGLAIIDAMNIAAQKVDVDVVCIGKAYSMASVILAAGTKGHRYIMPHGEVMVHEPLISEGAGGSASSVRSMADSLISVRDKISEMMSSYTGLSAKKINNIMRANTFMDAEKAIELGLADKVATEF